MKINWLQNCCVCVFSTDLFTYYYYSLFCQVPSRSVKELVEFYYIWKKSKRYEDFIIQHGKIGKKKVTLQPGQV